MLKTAKVKIKGLRPTLWHRFSPDVLSMERVAKTGRPGNSPDEWKTTAQFNPTTRKPYFLPGAIFCMLKEGATHTKVGRGSLKTKVIASLQVQKERIYLSNRLVPEELKVVTLDDEGEEQSQLEMYIDCRSVVNPATKGRNLRYRMAATAGWECDFLISWDDTIVSEVHMKRIVMDAGSLVGLSDARSIGMGRFELVSFTVIE